jgi:hypothetical protein
MSLFEEFFKVLSLCQEARIRIRINVKGWIRIRIKVTNRIRIRIRVTSRITATLMHTLFFVPMLQILRDTVLLLTWQTKLQYVLHLYRFWYDLSYICPFLMDKVWMLFLYTCHTVWDLGAVSGMIFFFTCYTVWPLIWFSLPVAHCAWSWYYLHLDLSHCGNCYCTGFRFTCHTVRDLVYYSALPVTLCGIWYIIPLYLSHCAGSGMIYPSSDSSHSTWEDWAFYQKNFLLNEHSNIRKRRAWAERYDV